MARLPDRGRSRLAVFFHELYATGKILEIGILVFARRQQEAVGSIARNTICW